MRLTRPLLTLLTRTTDVSITTLLNVLTRLPILTREIIIIRLSVRRFLPQTTTPALPPTLNAPRF